MTEEKSKRFETEEYCIMSVPDAIWCAPEDVRAFIRLCAETWKERAPRKKVSEFTEIIEMSPIFDDLEELIGMFNDEWKRVYWFSELERYKRESNAPPKVSF